MSKYGMKRERLLIELEMDSKHVEEFWPKLHEIIKDEKVKANVKSEFIKNNFPSRVNFLDWMQNGGSFFG